MRRSGKVKNIVKAIAGVICGLAWIMVFIISGSMEQDYISYTLGMALSIIDCMVIWITGRISGAINL